MEHYKVNSKEAGERLDRYLVNKLGKISRSGVKELIDHGRVKVNGKRVVIAKWEMIAGDEVDVRLTGFAPGHKEERRAPEGAAPKPRYDKVGREPGGFIKVVHEDRDILVVEKPAGVVIQSGAKKGREVTYVDQLRSYLKRKYKGSGAYVKPMHRLDKETSGLMVFATSRVGEQLVDQFRKHSVQRFYLVLVEGAVGKESGRIDLFISKGDFGYGKRAGVARRGEGQRAITEYLVKERYSQATLLRLDLKTGRTHQARVHLAAIKHPVVGDHVYGRRGGMRFGRHALHSHLLSFNHPRTGKKLKFMSELPEDMAQLVDELRGH